MLVINRCLCCALVFLVFLCLCGCPYESEFPLSPSSEAKIDKELIGKWKFQCEKEEQSGTITIYQFNEHEYLILLKEEGEEDIDLMRAFGTTIDDHKFLNTQDINSANAKEREWFFVNYSVFNDRLVLKYVEDRIFENKIINSSQELYQLMKENLSNKELYDENDKKIFNRVDD